VTNLENSTGFFDYLKTLISDEGFLNKASDFIIQKTEKRLQEFRKILSKLIDEYLEKMLTKINIEMNSLILNLEKQKGQYELENEKNKKFNQDEKAKYDKKIKEKEEEKKKWNMICQGYKKLEVEIKNFKNEDNNVIEYKIEGSNKNLIDLTPTVIEHELEENIFDDYWELNKSK
jgi:hypothetical protein